VEATFEPDVYWTANVLLVQFEGTDKREITSHTLVSYRKVSSDKQGRGLDTSLFTRRTSSWMNSIFAPGPHRCTHWLFQWNLQQCTLPFLFQRTHRERWTMRGGRRRRIAARNRKMLALPSRRLGVDASNLASRYFLLSLVAHSQSDHTGANALVVRLSHDSEARIRCKWRY
jgi:hypothetical protein